MSDTLRDGLLLRCLNSGSLSEYDEVETWREAQAMERDGLVTIQRVHTGSARINLTDAGRLAALQALQMMPRVTCPSGTAEPGTLAVRGGEGWPAGNVTVYQYRGWEVNWDLTNELRRREGGVEG